MKALVKSKPERGIWMAEQPLPVIGPDDVLVRVNRTGICGTDLHIFRWDAWAALPDEVDDDLGAVLDPLGNAVHTALSFDLVGEDVLIAGAGPIGIMAAAIARHVGARHVVITDVNPTRLALAGRVADCVPVDVSRQELRSVIGRLGMREGFDVGFEMSGTEAGFTQIADTLLMGGRIAMLGLPARPFPVDWSALVMKMITIKCIYGREMFETWHKMLAMLQSGLDIRGVITHRLPAGAYAEGFDLVDRGACGKVVLDWSAGPD